MRVIKFRAWDSENKVWLSEDEFSKKVKLIPTEDIAEVISRVGIEVNQWTGLRDKNGKDIYESDLVIDEAGKQGLVVWNNGLLRYRYVDQDGAQHAFDTDVLANHYIVLGNQYEDQDLLNAKQ